MTIKGLKISRQWRAPVVAALLASLAVGTRAQDTVDAGFQAYAQELAAKARGAGVSEATVERMTGNLAYVPRVIQLDRNQPGTSQTATPPAFTPYRLSHVDAPRIMRGRRVYQSLPDAGGFEARYGVPAQVVLAIWGAETDYGASKGGFDLANALATLAYDGRRRALFADEFVALLKMVDRGVPPEQLKGSWAGALGNPQFLPSTYLRLARDGDGDGYADVWNSREDTLASIAAYFRDAGWQRGVPWGVEATLPSDYDRARMATRLDSPTCPRVHVRHSQWKTIGEWRAMGVVPQGKIGENVLASLFEPDGAGKSAYLLTGNYRVILEYNCSNYYALSVGLLADEIAR